MLCGVEVVVSAYLQTGCAGMECLESLVAGHDYGQKESEPVVCWENEGVLCPGADVTTAPNSRAGSITAPQQNTHMLGTHPLTDRLTEAPPQLYIVYMNLVCRHV